MVPVLKTFFLFLSVTTPTITFNTVILRQNVDEPSFSQIVCVAKTLAQISSKLGLEASFLTDGADQQLYECPIINTYLRDD